MRVGIYSGTFDPIHKGHIAFALEAAKQANLDKVYFSPEIKPRHKPYVSHYGHRLAMLKLAIRSQPKLDILELPDANFSVLKTLPRIKAKFKDADITMLLGSDLFLNLKHWPKFEILINEVEFVVGVRQDSSLVEIEKAELDLPVRIKKLTIIQTDNLHISASQVRQEISDNGESDRTLESIVKYAKQHWLYSKIPHHD